MQSYIKVESDKLRKFLLKRKEHIQQIRANENAIFFDKYRGKVIKRWFRPNLILLTDEDIREYLYNEGFFDSEIYSYYGNEELHAIKKLLVVCNFNSVDGYVHLSADDLKEFNVKDFSNL
jgi:hypothetical protein